MLLRSTSWYNLVQILKLLLLFYYKSLTDVKCLTLAGVCALLSSILAQSILF